MVDCVCIGFSSSDDDDSFACLPFHSFAYRQVDSLKAFLLLGKEKRSYKLHNSIHSGNLRAVSVLVGVALKNDPGNMLIYMYSICGILRKNRMELELNQNYFIKSTVYFYFAYENC